MARDKKAREYGEEASLLGRRKYLQLAGAAVASVGTFAAGSTAAEDYRTVTVSAGETYRVNLGDGDTLENTLIDITASGADYRIIADGDDWAIRNVGVKGRFPDTSNNDDPIILQTDGGNGVVENFYLGDGCADSLGTGIFVFPDHAGDILMRNINIQGWNGNSIYASAPGNHDDHAHPGSGGTVRVENGYFADNGRSDIRLGTDGSYAKNCVMASTKHRSYWGYYNDTQLIDCDVFGTIVVGESAHDTHATVTLENTRHGGDSYTGTSNDALEGTSAGQPRDYVPDGVPTSAEEAASAQSSSTGDDSTTDDSTTTPDEDSSNDGQGTLLQLVADSDVSSATYEFTVEGSAAKATDVQHPADTTDSDAVTDNGDGTVTVSGAAGRGGGDSYYVDGVITSMTIDESKWTLTFGGEQVAPEDVVLPKKLIIDGSNRPNAASQYVFTVDGEVQKSGVLGSVNAYDTVSDGKITGRIIGGTDGYRFSGNITGFNLDGPANVHVKDNS